MPNGYKTPIAGKKKKLPSKVLYAIIFGTGIFAIVFYYIFQVFFPVNFQNSDRKFSDKSDSGYYIFTQILDKLDYKIKQTGEDDKLLKKTSVLLYSNVFSDKTPVNQYDTPEVKMFLDDKRLKDWVKEGNDLVLIGSEVLERYFEKEITDKEKYSQIVRNTSASLPKGVYRTKVFLKKEFIDGYSSYDFNILLKSDSGNITAAKIKQGKGSVLIIADIDFFANEHMKNVDYAYLLDGMMAAYKDKQILLIRRPRQIVAQPSIGKFMFNRRTVLPILHCVFLFFLFLYLMSKRFAPPENLSPKKQRESIEHTRATGTFYQNNRAWPLIEEIDSEFFKTILCKNKKPVELTHHEYGEFTKNKEDISPEEILRRFEIRTALQKRRDLRKTPEKNENYSARNGETEI